MKKTVLLLHLWRTDSSFASPSDSVLGVLFPLPKAREKSVLGIPRVSARRLAFRRYQENQLETEYQSRGIPLTRISETANLDSLLRFDPSEIVYQPSGRWEEHLFDLELEQWGFAHGVTITRGPRNTLVDPDELPFNVKAMPRTFTPFRQEIEKKPWAQYRFSSFLPSLQRPRSVPTLPPALGGLESPSGQARLDYWFSTTAPSTYKETRNQGGPMEASRRKPWVAKCWNSRNDSGPTSRPIGSSLSFCGETFSPIWARR